MHCRVPRMHGRVPDWPQVPMLVRPSSNMPLQLLSLPSQISAVPNGGIAPPTAPWHWIVPLMQWLTPLEHSPRSVPQFVEVPPPGSPSSAVPLQLLSLPSQISNVGFFVHPR